MMIRELDPAHDVLMISEICQQLKSPHFNWPLEKLQAELQSSKGLVCEIQNQVVAFLLFRELMDVLDITALGVALSWQRSGRMGALFQALIDAHGKQKELWLEVHEHNLAACNFYEKWSFGVVGKRSKYYLDGGAAVLYSRLPRKSS